MKIFKKTKFSLDNPFLFVYTHTHSLSTTILHLFPLQTTLYLAHLHRCHFFVQFVEGFEFRVLLCNKYPLFFFFFFVFRSFFIPHVFSIHNETSVDVWEYNLKINQRNKQLIVVLSNLFLTLNKKNTYTQAPPHNIEQQRRQNKITQIRLWMDEILVSFVYNQYYEISLMVDILFFLFSFFGSLVFVIIVFLIFPRIVTLNSLYCSSIWLIAWECQF